MATKIESKDDLILSSLLDLTKAIKAMNTTPVQSGKAEPKPVTGKAEKKEYGRADVPTSLHLDTKLDMVDVSNGGYIGGHIDIKSSNGCVYHVRVTTNAKADVIDA
jgi:hypothetical protein